jgi:hypothetical protein
MAVSASIAGGSDEGVEGSALGGVLLRGVLRVPLYSGEPYTGAGEFESFRGTVGDARGGVESLAGAVDPLVVAGCLRQGFVEDDVDGLPAAADRREGKARGRCLPGGFEAEGVLEVVDVADTVGGAVAVRAAIAAGEHGAVEACEAGGHVGGGGVGRVDDRRFAVGPPGRLDQCAGMGLGGAPGSERRRKETRRIRRQGRCQSWIQVVLSSVCRSMA